MASQELKIITSSIDVADVDAAEKGIVLVHSTTSEAKSGMPDAPSAPFDEAATKRLLRKLDLRLIPFLALIYLLCFLDRTNVGNARLFSLEKDLHMKDLDYNVALAIMFPFYVFAEVPSNMMMKRIRPSIWLAVIMVTWSIVMICMGFVRNYPGLLVGRSFLGLCEGGLFPGVSYYITMWYKRRECGTRLAFFFSAATAAGAFGGLIARGIAEMNNVGGYAGWRWIFILEGLLTLVVGSFAYWIIQDYPSTAGFLSTKEKIEVERRLADDNDGLATEFNMRYVYQALRDWKIWVMSVIAIGILTAIYSISLFLPTIIKEMGYSNDTAQLMTVPVYVVACFCTVAGNYASDKIGRRGIFVLGFEIIAIIGFVLLIATGKPHVQYAGTFFATSGIYCLFPMVLSWNGNNIGGSLKRGVGIAMQVGIGNLGGIIASFVYLIKDEPRFINGHAVLIALISMSLVLTLFMTIYLGRENTRRDVLLSQQNLSLENVSDDEKYVQREKGDDASFFRYTV
ncbi:putative transporter [Lachnellula hyalina]|uniref:Putative transporter n=1 Tax=Lachnellula hyalina TaxID=1316788 RepID=A0A8H8QX03_9HELO|nr:putative transporter [Lachnellula hyalina]TVY23280.1 putative transporter [Lachnellula hyalina]